jgi:hypothetical protein
LTNAIRAHLAGVGRNGLEALLELIGKEGDDASSGQRRHLSYDCCYDFKCG